MDCFCNKAAVRSHHKTAQLRINSNISHSCRNKNLFIDFTHTLSDHADIIRLLIRAVWNTDTAGKINKTDVRAGFLLKLHCKLKHNLCKHWVILICYSIAGKKRMNTKILRAFFFQNTECLKNLICCHSILGIPGIIHNIIADLEHTARIVTTADGFWNSSCSTLHSINVSDIVQVDNSANLIRITKLLFRCVIGRKHDISFSAAKSLCHHKLCHGRTVAATAILLKDLDQIWIGSCFYRKKLLKSFVPAKGFLQRLCIFADSFFIIKMKRCGKLRFNFF